MTLLISIILLALCVAGMAISILLKKNGSFPNTEVGSNPNLRKLGLRCPKEEEPGRLCNGCNIANKNIS